MFSGSKIKRWIESGVPVGKVKALLEGETFNVHDGWTALQEELMSVLRHVRASNCAPKSPPLAVNTRSMR